MFEQRYQLIPFRALMAASCLVLLAGCPAEKDAVQTESPAVPVAQVPATPTGLLGAAGDAQVGLSWSASSAATNYIVRRAIASSGPYGDIGTSATNSYMDSTAGNGIVYFYVVAAINSAGSSANSAQVSVAPAATALAVSTGLVASAGDAQVGLSWAASNNATSYAVRRATTSGGPYGDIGTTVNTSYVDTTAANGTTYFYVVAAVSAAVTSGDSAQVSAMPSAPNNGAPTPAGEWQNITPPVPQPWTGGSFSGGQSPFFGWTSIDGAKADAPGTLYVLIDHAMDQYSGIWKTINGGQTWTYLNQGPNGELKASGFLRVDPTDSKIVYQGIVKSSSGLFKTTNGGTSWTQILPSNYEHDLYGLSIDPYNHLHLLLSFHSCQVNWPLVSGGTDGAACGILESLDGGATWIVHHAGGWTGSSQFAFFVGQKNDNSPDSSGSFWIVSNQSGQGIWRTENAGSSWTQVGNFDQTHGMQSLYRAANKALYMGSVGKIFRSVDNGRSWSDTGAPSSGDGYGGIMGDGTHVWAMLSNTGGAAFGPYKWQTLSETDSTSSPTNSQWKTFGTVNYTDGPDRVVYDPVNKVLYSSQWGAGVFKLDVAQ